MKNNYIAHISEDGRVQTVKEHLEGTALLAADFARAFDGAELGFLTGLSHDIGKYSGKFQERIRNPKLHQGLDHSTAGAQLLWMEKLYPAAFAVAGHHGGLPDGGTKAEKGQGSTMLGRVSKNVEDCGAWREELKLPAARLPERVPSDAFSQAFFTRMLYSCLVDADYLDTEGFMSGGKVKRGTGQPLDVLLNRLNSFIEPFWQGEGTLNHLRCQVLRTCVERGANERDSLYTLTVPTGGGKTLSSLAFGLYRAVKADKDRVIYVIPYHSIIDQTAAVFRKALGEESVIEHHSAAEYNLGEGMNDSALASRKALATENWDAPVIVTTAVQFFESLFANRGSRCRKLHNIANSVIIFDEAQTLPVNYLRPCVAAIGQLIRFYGVTAVLCTATQPALEELFQEFAPGLAMKEIYPDQEILHSSLRRTTVRDLGILEESELRERLASCRQALCVVNRKKTAESIYRSLSGEGNFCLFTLIYPEERKKKLEEIRRRLKEGLPCRVISTSLIEAGVDVDFPVAFREEAGLDSIIQTAGRCNREGRRSAADSPIYVFRLKGQKIPAMIRQNVDAARAVIRDYADIASLEAIRAYFKLYRAQKGREGQDIKGILEAFSEGWSGRIMPFASVAENFHLIETPARTIYIPRGAGAHLVERLRRGEVSRSLFRALGQFAVSVYPDHFQKLEQAGALELLEDGSAILLINDYYDEEVGLILEPEGGYG